MKFPAATAVAAFVVIALAWQADREQRGDAIHTPLQLIVIPRYSYGFKGIVLAEIQPCSARQG